MNDKEKVLERLRFWVQQKGWSKSEFARRMKIHAQHVNGYLDGRYGVENLFFSLQQEGCDVNWLLTGEQSADEAEMLKMLKDSGIDTKEKLSQLLRIEAVFEEIVALATSRTSYNQPLEKQKRLSK